MSHPKACQHCGIDFTPKLETERFCCTGCEYVHSLIEGAGLERFYELKDRATQPARSVVFEQRDYAWLQEAIQKTETASNSETATLELDLQGLSCVGCVWLIEKLFESVQGGVQILLNSNLGQARIRFVKGQTDLVEFARELQRFGYTLGPLSFTKRNSSSGILMRLGLCGAFAMNAMLFTLPSYLGVEDEHPHLAPLFTMLTVVFASFGFFVGGGYFLKRAWLALKGGVMHVDLPISIGLIAAYAGSLYAWYVGFERLMYFDFVAVFSFLMLLGRWTQQVAVERNRNQLLGAAAGPESIELEDGTVLRVESLLEGASYKISRGKIVPVRSRLGGAKGLFSLEWINGESDACTFESGQIIPSGAIYLGDNPASLQSLELWEGSLLERLLAKDSTAEGRDLLLEKITRHYLFAVLMLAGIGLFFWWPQNALFALQVMISILVVSCPCALGVALPLADELAVSRLRKGGVFIRSALTWARLRKVKKLIFDKTGTLTLETLRCTNPEALDVLTPEELSYLYAMVELNLHPVSRALRETLLVRRGKALTPLPLCAEEHIGHGLELTGEHSSWTLGQVGWKSQASEQNKGASCVFARDGKILAAFFMEEALREDARALVQRWLQRGLEVFILSGDRDSKVNLMARTLGLKQEAALGQMSPDAKAQWVQKIDNQDTLFIGDGANDSLAFDAAYCRGTPAVDRGLLEHKCDFYFMGTRLEGLENLFAMVHARARAYRGVFIFAVLYNITVVALAFAGWMSPLLAAILMPLSSLACVGIVGLCLRRKPRKV